MGLGKTEWEDILIEKGIIPAPPQPDAHEEAIVYSTSNQPAEHADASDSDALDDLPPIDDDFMAAYQRKRFAELQRPQFGEVVEISRGDFVAEVTEASHQQPVLLFLYQSCLVPCQQLAKFLKEQAAPQNRSLKFVQMVATRCIENYPDANLPTIILYRGGNVQRQLLRTDPHQLQLLIDQIHAAEAEEQQK